MIQVVDKNVSIEEEFRKWIKENDMDSVSQFEEMYQCRVLHRGRLNCISFEKLSNKLRNSFLPYLIRIVDSHENCFDFQVD